MTVLVWWVRPPRLSPSRPHPRLPGRGSVALAVGVRRSLAVAAPEALLSFDPVSERLLTVPGVGTLTATALVGAVGHIHAFERGRQFASWLGLTSREYSSGGRRRLGRISKRGDRYLRYLLTHGARAVLVTAARRRRAGQSLSRLHEYSRLEIYRSGGRTSSPLSLTS